MPTDAGRVLTLILQPDVLEVREALKKLRVFVARTLSDDMVASIEIISAETLNNVVEHGFADPTLKYGIIELKAQFDDGKLVLSCIDNGQAMPGGALPPPKRQTIDRSDLDNLPEGGFGWAMIHALADDIVYARTGGKNHLTITIGV